MIVHSLVNLLVLLALLLMDNIRITYGTNKMIQVSSEEGLLEILRMLHVTEKYPLLSKNGICYVISNVTAEKISPNTFTILLRVDVKSSTDKQLQICHDYTEKKLNQNKIEDSTNASQILTSSIDNPDSFLALSQTIGIAICGFLLTIFFFIAGFIRIKNFLRRNKTTQKVNGLRSCLNSDEEVNKWRTSYSDNNITEPTISNYLQLQSTLDRRVSQFMIKPAHHSKSKEQERKTVNSSSRRKTSIRNKLIPKRYNPQSVQRRYSLSNEIDSVMNKHFNMIGVTRKSGSRSTQNIDGILRDTSLHRSHISQRSLGNEYNSSVQRCSNQNPGAMNKSQSNRYFRNGNFPYRRATTIGGRSTNRPVTSLRGLNANTPPTIDMYSSHHSNLNNQKQNLLRKQPTLIGSRESYDRYLENSQSVTDNRASMNRDKPYLKVPSKLSNFIVNKKYSSDKNEEKTSPSQESMESHSRCSSFEKASSLWSSLDVQDSEAPKKDNN